VARWFDGVQPSGLSVPSNLGAGHGLKESLDRGERLFGLGCALGPPSASVSVFFGLGASVSSPFGVLAASGTVPGLASVVQVHLEVAGGFRTS